MNKFHPHELFENNTFVIPEQSIQQDQFTASNPNIIQSSNLISQSDDFNDEMLSNVALNYINHMLMAEDSKIYTYKDYAALEATQNSFYQIIKENNPNPSSDHSSPDAYATTSSSSGGSSSSSSCNIDFSEPEKERNEDLFFASHSRKYRQRHNYDLESEVQRSLKQSNTYNEEAARTPMFDDLLLSHGDNIPKAIIEIQEALHHASLKSSKKKRPKKEFVDLCTLLINCSHTISSDDQITTNQTLKQIRQHSSPSGDGNQRLAHYFADAIEARLSGTGSEIYSSFNSTKRTASDYLKAYGLYIAASPFKKLSYFFSNQTILNASRNASCVHIIDFGINFGFQWPAFIQRMSQRVGGPPKVRITGIDFPQPGFRPEERILETGRRLDDYARSFNVPLEYKPIASKWEDVRVEDVEIRKGEVLIVNCLFLARFLPDETVDAESPRNKFLSAVRRMDPDVFVHGIENGAYGSPFFVTRFREAAYHFSALYDMLETVVGREDEERKLIEREIFGRAIMNVIACEGTARRERPETYKQWQVRMARAGFVKNGLDEEMMRRAKEKGRRSYHKDFDVDQSDGWMLQGWKGRIVYALSAWRPDKMS